MKKSISIALLGTIFILFTSCKKNCEVVIRVEDCIVNDMDMKTGESWQEIQTFNYLKLFSGGHGEPEEFIKSLEKGKNTLVLSEGNYYIEYEATYLSLDKTKSYGPSISYIGLTISGNCDFSVCNGDNTMFLPTPGLPQIDQSWTKP